MRTATGARRAICSGNVVVGADAPLRLSLCLAGLDHHFHGVGIFADHVGALCDRPDLVISSMTRETALMPKKLVNTLADGSIKALTAGTTCAVAGIIVGIVTLTGLGLKFSAILIDYAGGSLLLTAIYTALIVWIIGLAVPVTASYIICAVIAAPAMINLAYRRRRAHVHLLLRGAIGSFPAHRFVTIRGRGDHRRRSLPDDAAGVEIHPARLPRAVSICADPQGWACCCGSRPAAPGSISP